MEASRAKASGKADDLVMRLVQATSYIHSALSLEYGLADELSEPQLAFRHLQTEVAENEEALRVANAEISILQVLLDIESERCTLTPSLKRELVHLRH